MRAVSVTAMNQGDRTCPVAQLLSPIERRVPAADDDDALAAELFRICDAVKNSPPVPRVSALLWQAPRRERSDTRRDDDRARRKSIAFCDQDKMISALLERDHVLVEV